MGVVRSGDGEGFTDVLVVLVIKRLDRHLAWHVRRLLEGLILLERHVGFVSRTNNGDNKKAVGWTADKRQTRVQRRSSFGKGHLGAT